MAELKIAFLDLNGTLVDDWEVTYKAICHIFDHFQKPRPTLKECFESFSFTGDYAQIYRLYGITASRKELNALFVPAYLEHLDSLEEIRGARRFIRHLKDRGVEVHLLTAAMRNMAEPLIDFLGITEWFDSCHFHIHDKAAQVQVVTAQMPLVPDEVLVVGDMLTDIQAAATTAAKSAFLVNHHTPLSVQKAAEKHQPLVIGKDFFEITTGLQRHFHNI